jgi:hypothetical protein
MVLLVVLVSFQVGESVRTRKSRHASYNPYYDCLQAPVFLGAQLHTSLRARVNFGFLQAPLSFFSGAQLHSLRARVYFGLQMGRNVRAQSRLVVAKQLCQNVTPLNEIFNPTHDTH